MFVYIFSSASIVIDQQKTQYLENNQEATRIWLSDHKAYLHFRCGIKRIKQFPNKKI